MYNYYICLQICLLLDISLFTGTKILPDPHYKPPKDKKKSNGNAAKINIQIASNKNDRSLASSNKPEFIALSSDEENEESNDDGDQEQRSKKVGFFKAASRGDLKMLKNMIKNGFKDIDQFQD